MCDLLVNTRNSRGKTTISKLKVRFLRNTWPDEIEQLACSSKPIPKENVKCGKKKQTPHFKLMVAFSRFLMSCNFLCFIVGSKNMVRIIRPGAKNEFSF